MKNLINFIKTDTSLAVLSLVVFIALINSVNGFTFNGFTFLLNLLVKVVS